MSLYYDAQAALLAMIRTCMGGDACDYQTFVSLGIPPAVCSSIVSYFDGSIRTNDTDDCFMVSNDTFVVIITRCCNDREDFTPSLENDDAQCFLMDLEALKTCLICNLTETLEPYNDFCAPYISEIQLDSVKQGGCYSAEFRIVMVEQTCCPPPVPPPVP